LKATEVCQPDARVILPGSLLVSLCVPNILRRIAKITQMGKINTEEIIIAAATEEFTEKGFDGCRMRSISERAGINKGLLHYYFKSKDALFAKAFIHIFGTLMNKLTQATAGEKHLFEKIRAFTDTYISSVQSNPKIPRFIMNEMSKNPERLLVEVRKQNQEQKMAEWIRSVKEAKEQGDIIDISPEHLFVNMLSQCIFPFLGRPMIQYVTELDDPGFDRFIEERKTLIAETLIRSIQTRTP
jgi:AcrR family transcriptional regulator